MMTSRSDVAAGLLARAAALVDAELERLLPKSGTGPGRVHEAMRYSVFSGGKRLRPAIALAVAAALGIDARHALPAACALELIHAFSLIHDDLPAMDDDDLRRGRPTCHKVFGEAVAILAGDALSVYAFEVVAVNAPHPATVPALIVELARASGTAGMIGGQILDLAAEDRDPSSAPSQALVDEIHLQKTAALLRAAAVMPAIAGGCSAAVVASLGQYGELLGRAFQIADDILDETGTPEQLGKATHKDRERGKATYPAAVGVDASRVVADHLTDQAIAAIAGIDRTGDLAALARFVVQRNS